MFDNEINEKILEHLKFSKSPLTLDSISEYFNTSQNRAERALDELIMGGHVEKIYPQNSNIFKKAYYTCSKNILVEDNIKTKGITDKIEKNDINKEIAQEVVNVKDGFTDLVEKVNQIDKNVNGIYANIISIMSIFVAIFALITVNANITFKLTEESLNDVFVGIILINIFVVVCLIVLLFGVKHIIINPMINKK